MSVVFENRATNGGYNFAPPTEENGPLAKYKIGETIHKVVRVMECCYLDGNGFYIYHVEENDRWFSIKGTFPYNLALNSYYEITGTIAIDKKRGTRYVNVSSCNSTLPTNEEGIITVLRTLHGLDTQARRLYDYIGPDVLDLIMKDPAAVAAKVPGVGVKRARGWQQELLAHGENDRELKKLYEIGLNQTQATKLVAKHGITICEGARQNPYRLIGEVYGYTFVKCDKYALEGGRSIRDPLRLAEGLLYTMRSVEMRGHCTYPKKEFMQAAHSILDISLSSLTAKQFLRNQKAGGIVEGRWGNKTYTISVDDLAGDLKDWEAGCREKSYRYLLDYIEDDLMNQTLNTLQTSSKLICETVNGTEYVTPGKFFNAERTIVSGLRDLTLNERSAFSDVKQVIDAVLAEQGVTLEDKQMEAVLRICAAEGGAFILNGSAGCGKTFTLNIIMEVLHRLYLYRKKAFNPCILAPTGKAAKVAASITHLPAHTIHMALGLVSSADDNDVQIASKELTNNCVVVDEFSMVDELLGASLIDGIPKTAKVIFMGDTQQLPSIRAGRLLKNLIDSEAIPVITLDVVKRQDAQSGILHNANRIIQGQTIDTFAPNKTGTNGNAYVIEETDPAIVQKRIVSTAKQYGLKSFQNGDIQILCPLKAGPTGVEALNYYIQQVLNPSTGNNEIVVGRLKLKNADGSEYEAPKCFRVGDCVINTRNDYNQPWFKKHKINGFIETAHTGVINGDTGVVEAISVYKDGNNFTHRVIYVKYDDHYIAYDNEYDNLMLAYALTIHKSQGSQWPNIICPIVQDSIIMNRKIMYSMYTRAQNSNIVIGSPRIINRAIQNNREDLRLTLLEDRLCGRLY